LRLPVLLLALALLAACQRETPDVSQNNPSKSSTAAGSPQTAPPQSTSVNPAIPPETDERSSAPTAAAPTQEVHLMEYMVHMPANLAAGRVGFNVENAGKEDHAFEIEGNGIHQKTEVLKQGGTASLTVDLKPGTYTVYCPVKDHAQKGMKTTITVQ